ncbi:YbaN family protein [Vibrio mangrovi]|uniref:Inner membrane protein n=1 Tax=Vibrio mangrovi TaxID=474394 RepID=A0A1Y6IPY1_9VIBR|nr:YbaN family protein [Vibrio mangrovi]MDW6003501.1 YbaN family protein [Vibrio mangrovi]SMR99707.1 Inner membrane protein YbaN [Vibrio mangrovi]
MKSRIVVWLFTTAGILALGLGIAGIFLPLLPTTPFVLLASACFIKSNPSLHRWLIAHPVFGPLLENWQERRAISSQVRLRGSVAMIVTFSFSIWMVPYFKVKIGLLLFFIMIFIIFRRIPVYDPVAKSEENH